MRAAPATAATALGALRATLAAEGIDCPPNTAQGGPAGALATAAARAATDAGAYSFVMESVLEGYLLHYGRPRLPIADPDLRLLAGDLAYALGLARLAEIGDMAAVAELADLISLCAQVHADGRAACEPGGDSLPAALWAGSALALGTGPWAHHEQVKEAVRAGRPGAREDALAAVRARAAGAGIGADLSGALIAFRQMFNPSPRSA